MIGFDNHWLPLVVYERNGVIENTIYGAFSWWSGGREVHSSGGEAVCYARSTMKPFYLKPFAEILSNQLNDQQKAIALASHNGSEDHVRVAQSLLSPSDWGRLRVPEDRPLVPTLSYNGELSRWQNNSSGHHAALLKACLLKGESVEDYTSSQHLIFRSYEESLKKLLGENWSPRCVGVDGDGLPTLAMNLTQIAQCYGALPRQRHGDWIWSAMVAEPYFVGGDGRLDTSILSSCEGAVLAKEGADGLLALAIEHDLYPEGLGIVIKMAHGWDPRATWFMARGLLGALGFDLPGPEPLHRQQAWVSSQIVPSSLRQELADKIGLF